MKCRVPLSLFFVLSVCLSATMRAAEPSTVPVLRIEAGTHTSAVRRISADVTGRLVLTVSHDKTARLWELPSGRLVRVLRPPLGEADEGKLNACALSPDGTLAAVAGWSGYEWDQATSVYLFDTSTGRVLRRLSGVSTTTNDLAFSPQGRFLAATLAHGEGLRLWETATGREIGRDPKYGESYSYSVDWHGEGRLVTTCLDGQLRLYGLTTAAGASTLWLLKKSVAKGGQQPFSARFSPDGRRIAVGFSDSTAVTVVDGGDLSFLFSPDTRGVDNGNLSSVAWTDDGATLAAAGRWNRDDGLHAIRRWPIVGRGQPYDTAVSLDTIMNLRSLPGGGILFGAFNPGWGVLPSAKALRPQTPSGIEPAPRQSAGASPLANFRDVIEGIRLSGNGTLVSFRYGASDKMPARFSVSDGLLDFLKDGVVPASLGAPRTNGLLVTDWKDGVAPKLVGKPLALRDAETSRSLAISSDASSFLLGADWTLRSYTADGRERWNMSTPGVAWSVNLADRDRLAVAAYDDGTIRWHRADTGQELLAFFPHADRKRWVLWATEYRIEKVGVLGAGLEMVAGKVAISRILAASAAAQSGLRVGDELVSFDGASAIDVETSIATIQKRGPGEEMKIRIKRPGQELNVVVKLGERIVDFGPKAFYYDCSPGAEELIGWHVNRGKDQAADFYPAAKFRDQFYRPDIVRQVLAKGDVEAAVQAANEAIGRKAPPALRLEEVVAKMQPPVVELAIGGARSEASVPAAAANFAIRYRVRRGSGELVTRVRVLVDGRPTEIQAPVPASDTAEVSAQVPLPSRDCIVAVLAENRFAVSEPATLRVVRADAPAPDLPATPPDAPTLALRPKLYLLAAGISDYVNNDQLDDLHFAGKDAGDFTAAFQRQEGGLYQKVETRVLTDQEATATNIRDGLDWIRQETTAKDVAVIFLSGHGENDEELRYFFCAQDYDKKRRSSTGVSFEEIQRSVRAIPGKVLFFIDSCHAGNALGKLFAAKSATRAQVDVTRLINELSDAENGAIVFTSSTGRQLSLELSQEKNGAFTKAIVEGLDGKADLRNNGRITVSSLEFFLAERVKELTDGQQTPTVAKPQTVPDFPIAVKR